VIATKVGYDFVHHGEARGRGQREIPQDFSPDAVTRATDAALNRLKTLTGKKFRKFFASNLSATAGLNDLLTSACARNLSARRSVFSRTSSNQLV